MENEVVPGAMMDAVEAPPVEMPQQQQQNMIPQDQVNRIVAREKQRAAEAARKAAEDRYAQQMQGANSQQNPSSAPMRELDADAIYQQVQDKFNQEQERLKQQLQEQQLKEQMTQVANSYLQKVEAGKKSYQDFDEVTKNFDPTEFPQLTYILSGIENAGEVLYDLSKNSSKLANISWLAEKSPRQAQAELQRLAKSITDNRQAQAEAQEQDVSGPLDRLNPSMISGSNGKMGIRDLRNQDWLRG